MENPESLDPEQPAPRGSKAPEKPIRKRNLVKIAPKTEARKPKATPTAILCELTRLKAQQKYLECNQVKLNPNNFILQDEEEGDQLKIETHSDKDTSMDIPETGNRSQRPNSSSTMALISLINEIEQEKRVLNEKLQEYRKVKRDELQDMWHFVATIKEDVFRPERLSLYTVNALRERIIGVNGQLERLGVKNSKELETLKQEYEKLERENTFMFPHSF